jgi:DUF971 family protein
MYLVTKLHYHRNSKILDVHFDDGVQCSLNCEYLRTHSPSAEVQGHGQAQSNLIVDKQQVRIVDIEPVGHYAVRLNFDDGHCSGIYSWQYFRSLAENKSKNWQNYLARVAEHTQNKHSVPIKFIP